MMSRLDFNRVQIGTRMRRRRRIKALEPDDCDGAEEEGRQDDAVCPRNPIDRL